MNLVERFFRDLTEFISGNSFVSTRQLGEAIIAFLAARNETLGAACGMPRAKTSARSSRQTGARRRPVRKQRYFRDATLGRAIGLSWRSLPAPSCYVTGQART
jgi:hypothetical protein